MLAERIPVVLLAAPVPNSLAQAMSEIVPIRNAQQFRDALPLITASNTVAGLADRLQKETIAFLSYQAPEKVIAGYELIGHQGILTRCRHCGRAQTVRLKTCGVASQAM